MTFSTLLQIDSRVRRTGILAMLVALGLCTVGIAQPVGPSYRLPPTGVSRQSGVSVLLRSDGLHPVQPGYRELQVEVASPNPVTADTPIDVRVVLYDWNRRRNILSVERSAELLAGETSATVSLRYPQQEEAGGILWDVWIDGRHDPKLSVDVDSFRPFPVGQVAMPQVGLLHGWNADAEFSNLFGGVWAASSQSGRVVQFTTRPLSADWRDYVAFDLVKIRASSLLAAAKAKPNEVAALRKWVSTGGTLWVVNTSEGFQRLDELSEALGFDEANEPTAPSEDSLAGVHGWNYVDLSKRQLDEQEDGLVSDFDPRSQASAQRATGGTKVDSLPVYSKDWFAVRRLGWGRVGVFEGDWQAVPGALRQRHRTSAASFWQEQTWPRRHGLAPGQANIDFSNWLIPGVGLAPVLEFQVLITLFVLAIGPLHYWLLKRAGRLQLMVITVPLIAVLITGALLAYGVLADGFSTRLRTQSITLLDEKQGEAVSWSRLSYYAAFAPSEGLTFSADALVYPIEPGSNESFASRGGRPPREIVWTGEAQRFSSGWLASRTPTQFLAVEPRKTEKGLGVEIERGVVSVTSGFDEALQLVVVCDEQGGWHLIEGLGAGQTVKLEPIKHSDAVMSLRSVLKDREPSFPDAIAAARDSRILYESRRRRRRRRSQTLDYSHQQVAASKSLLQLSWQELLGFSGSEALDLPRGSYLVVGDRALFPPSLDTFTVEDASVHIVIGSW